MHARKAVQSGHFKRDLRKISQSGRYQLEDLQRVVSLLAQDVSLPEKYCDHKLSGDWNGFRECHIKPNWLLIYQKPERLLVLVRTGSHSELF